MSELVDKLTVRGFEAYRNTFDCPGKKYEQLPKEEQEALRAFTRAVLCGSVMHVRQMRREAEGHGEEFHAPPQWRGKTV